MVRRKHYEVLDDEDEGTVLGGISSGGRCSSENGSISSSTASTNNNTTPANPVNTSLTNTPLNTPLPYLSPLYNLSSLPKLSLSAISTILHNRYTHNIPYTLASNILISINPYKPTIPFPLIKKNVTYVISGESGAGKTFLANEIISKCCDGVIIRDAFVVLEAFGNARTSNNCNSSRFGKIVRMNERVVIDAFLLEESRVTHGAYNFHIFYQLVNYYGWDVKDCDYMREGDDVGCGREEGFGDDENRNGSKCAVSEEYPYRVEGENSVYGAKHSINSTFSSYHTFTATLNAITTLSLSLPAIKSILYNIIQLGKLHTPSQHSLISKLSSSLKTDISDLFTKKLRIKDEIIVSPLEHAQFKKKRDRLARTLYKDLFYDIVNRINEGLRGVRVFNSCSVIDIFGFECVDRNGYEQFLINYANEKMQKCYLRELVVEREKEYLREGIIRDDRCGDVYTSGTSFHARDQNGKDHTNASKNHAHAINAYHPHLQTPLTLNSNILHLIENRTGIINIIKDESKLKTDLITKIKQFNNTPIIKTDNDRLTLVHSIGEVTYDVSEFVRKNNFDLVDSYRREVDRMVDEIVNPVFVRCIKPNRSNDGWSGSSLMDSSDDLSCSDGLDGGHADAMNGNGTAINAHTDTSRTGTHNTQFITDTSTNTGTTTPNSIKYDKKYIKAQLLISGILNILRMSTYEKKLPLHFFNSLQCSLCNFTLNIKCMKGKNYVYMDEREYVRMNHKIERMKCSVRKRLHVMIRYVLWKREQARADKDLQMRSAQVDEKWVDDRVGIEQSMRTMVIDYHTLNRSPIRGMPCKAPCITPSCKTCAVLKTKYEIQSKSLRAKNALSEENKKMKKRVEELERKIMELEKGIRDNERVKRSVLRMDEDDETENVNRVYVNVSKVRSVDGSERSCECEEYDCEGDRTDVKALDRTVEEMKEKNGMSMSSRLSEVMEDMSVSRGSEKTKDRKNDGRTSSSDDTAMSDEIARENDAAVGDDTINLLCPSLAKKIYNLSLLIQLHIQSTLFSISAPTTRLHALSLGNLSFIYVRKTGISDIYFYNEIKRRVLMYEDNVRVIGYVLSNIMEYNSFLCGMVEDVGDENVCNLAYSTRYGGDNGVCTVNLRDLICTDEGARNGVGGSSGNEDLALPNDAGNNNGMIGIGRADNDRTGSPHNNATNKTVYNTSDKSFKHTVITNNLNFMLSLQFSISNHFINLIIFELKQNINIFKNSFLFRRNKIKDLTHTLRRFHNLMIRLHFPSTTQYNVMNHLLQYINTEVFNKLLTNVREYDKVKQLLRSLLSVLSEIDYMDGMFNLKHLEESVVLLESGSSARCFALSSRQINHLIAAYYKSEVEMEDSVKLKLCGFVMGRMARARAVYCVGDGIDRKVIDEIFKDVIK